MTRHGVRQMRLRRLRLNSAPAISHTSRQPMPEMSSQSVRRRAQQLPVLSPIETCRSSTLTLADLLHRIETEPATAAPWLRMEAEKSAASARRSTYIIAAAVYALAERLLADDDAWAAFRGLSFWNKHRAPNRKHVLRHAFLFVYGRHDGREAARARDHARALLDLWEDRIPPKAVPDLLERRGGFAAARPTGDTTFDDLADDDTDNDPTDLKPRSSARICLDFRDERMRDRLCGSDTDRFWVEVEREQLSRGAIRLVVVGLDS